MIYDYIVIGGGIVGLSSAYHLKLNNAKLNVAELKKKTPYQHTKQGIIAV